MRANSAIEIDVYGCTFRVSGGNVAPMDNLAEDFAFFLTKNVKNPVRIELVEKEPPYDEVPEGVATIYTPRNVSLTKDGITYIDYGGRALGIWKREEGLFELYSKEPDLQYEATYLFLLSKIGEQLDGRRLHRLHAMAMSSNGQAVLLILPMGGGKSTLAQGLLRYPEFQFLSDDSPFISRDGRVHAFPLRLGLLPGNEADIPADRIRTINRMEFGPKLLVNHAHFAHKISPSASPGIVFLGRRSLSSDCRIRPATVQEKYHSMLVNCVVGLGLFQGMEFLLNRSPLELRKKVGVSWSRLRNARKLFAESRVYKLILGRNQQLNAETVREFINDRLG